MNPRADDTIAAISTPLSGEGGIGIVRISGERALKIADKIFRSKKGKPSSFKSHTIHYGWIQDIDEVLLSVMHAPATYTREDVVEISGHGGPVVLRKILGLCIKCGARHADPGEFTKRAFLNGRIDLVKAEAVADLIRARTDRAAALAAQQMKGAFSAHVSKMRVSMIKIAAELEAELDYSDEEKTEFLSGGNALNTLRKIINDLQGMLAVAERNKVFTGGVKIAIAGKPNVGKSSLLNAILLEERAIVSSIPGTTRDVISETVNIDGIAATFMDTAGISVKDGSGEKLKTLSVRYAKMAIERSDLVLFVIDGSRPPDVHDLRIAKIIIRLSKKTILVFNKSDLSRAKNAESGFSAIATGLGGLLAAKVRCSALKKTGMDGIHRAVFSAVTSNQGQSRPGAGQGYSQDIPENSFYANTRQEALLKAALKKTREAADSLKKNEPLELAALNLRSAMDSFALLAGEITSEDILDSVFSRFCLGK